MYRKEVADKIGEWNTTLFCAEDYDYCCRIALNGKISYRDEILYDYRLNSKSLTATKKELLENVTKEIIKKYSLKILEKSELSKDEQVRILLNKNFYPQDLFLELARIIDNTN